MSFPVYALLGKKRFLPLFITQFLEALNDNLFKNSLVIILTYQTLLSTRSINLLIVLASGLFILPYFIFSALAGQIADKYDKASVIRIIKIIEVLTLLIGAISLVQRNLPLMFFTLSLLGVHSTFFGPIKYSILPQHLKSNELIAGNALIESSTFIAILIGTSVGGYIVSLPRGHELIATLSILLAVSGLLSSIFIPTAPSADPKLKISWRIVRDTLLLMRYAKKDEKTFLSILGISWFWVIGFLFLAQLPAFAKNYLHTNANVTTFILAVCCIGIAVGSILCERLQKGEINALYVPIGVLGMTFCFLDLYFASDSLVTLQQSKLIGFKTFFSSLPHWRILIDVFLATVFGGLYSVPLYAIVQSRAKASQRSRIIASNNVINAMFMVLSALLTLVLLALHFTIPQIFLTIGLFNGVVALVICRLLPYAVLKPFALWILNWAYRVKVNGLEHYQHAPKRLLIIANHVSFLDALLLSAYLPDKLTFAIHSDYAKKWWMKPILQLVEAFPLDPANPMQLKELAKKLKNNRRCMIFPEGRLTVTGSLMKIYQGPALIADKAQAAMLPIHIEGAQFTPFTRLKGMVRRRLFPKIIITILPARKLQVPGNLRGRDRREKLGRKLYDLMCELIYFSHDEEKTLFESLIEARKTFGGKHIILEDNNRKPFTYHELLRAAFVLGNHLQKIIGQQKYVGILLPNAVGAIVTLFALYSRGRVPAMLNYSTGSHNVLSACQTAQIKTICTSRRFIRLGKLDELIAVLIKQKITILYLEDIKEAITLKEKLLGTLQAYLPTTTFNRINQQADSQSPAVVLFTSGSEGNPKGVVLAHQNLQANRFQIGSRIDFNVKDIIFNALPLFHSFGFSMAMTLPLFSGVKIFLYPSPLHYRIVPELVYDTDATLLFGTDTFLAGYARYGHPYDFYSLRYVFAGAERVREETKTLWLEKFGVRIFEGYGATETAPVLSCNTPMHVKPGSVGRLLPNIQYKLEYVPGINPGGRLWVKGPNIMLGYLRADNPGIIDEPEAGWYDTGDIVAIDAEGFVFIQGRAKRFAKIGGEMVSLTAVEAHLSTLWPDHQLAVVSANDDKKGEQLILFTNHPQATRQKISRYFQKIGLSELFVPRTIKILEELPLLGSGKIDYPALSTLLK